VFATGSSRWFRTELGLDRAGVVSYDIDESSQAGNNIRTSLELEGFDVTTYTVSFAAPDFAQAVADMKRRDIQIVFDTMDDGANRRLCDAMASGQFEPVAKVSTVVVMGDKVGENYNDTCRNVVYITGSSRPYSLEDEPAIAEFREAFEQYQGEHPFHQWALEAWAIGTMFKDVMEDIGDEPTREKLVDGLNELRDYTADGIMVDTEYEYVPEDLEAETGENCITISRWQDAEGGWTEETADYPFCYPDAQQYRVPALEQGN
jgi:hypothetical protein